ncbi:MAG: hypothetical protein V4569_14640 [Pseudomonadota bacterium]
MSGVDPSIAIPSVRVMLEAGAAIKQALAARSGGVIGRFVRRERRAVRRR